MAPESVKKIPGLDDLLVPLFNMKDPQLVSAAAGNVYYPTVRGIRAIGTLLYSASQEQEFGSGPVSRHAIGEIGCLLELLADQADLMHVAICNAMDERYSSDKDFVEVPVLQPKSVG